MSPSATSKCILCLEQKGDFAPEHVFPESIGGSFTISRVCTGCNTRLGSDVDSHLTDHWLIQTRRRELTLAGKKGSLPRPRLVGEVDDLPGVKVFLEYGSDGETVVRVQSSVITKPNPDPDGTSTKTVIVGDEDLHQLPARINKILLRGGKPPLSEKDLAETYPVHTLAQPAVTFTPEIDIHDYRRAVIKIAFELSHRWLGDSYLEDATAQLMRDIILNPSFSPEDFQCSELRGQILLGGDFLPALPMDFSARHLAYMTRMQGRVAVCIQIFDIFQALLLVSHDAQGYAATADPALLLNARDRTFTESTLPDLLRSVLNEQRGATAG